MGASKVAEIVSQELRQLGHPEVRLSGRGGTWTQPASLEYEIEGKRFISPFWEGSHPDEKIAESVVIDVLSAIWGLPTDEARARLFHQRSAALR